MRPRLIAGLILTSFAAAGGASAQAADPTTETSTATTEVVVNANTGPGSSSGTGANSPGGSGGSAGRNLTEVRYSGHEWTTPSVQGSYFAGANPCLIGVGASGAGGPIGLSFTFGRSDQGCQRRSDAAAWHALGHDDVAIARMCQDDDNHAAFEAVGYTCPQARPKAVLTSANVLTPAALPPLAAPTLAIVPAAAHPRPGWCETVTGAGERARYKQVCKF